MSDTQTAEVAERPHPPYIAFRTITDIIERMADEEPPARIDKSYLDNYSGGYRTQVIAALNTLGLRGPAGEVEDRLLDLVKADADKRKALFAEMVREQYAAVLALGNNATQQQLLDAFKELGVNPGDTMRKVIAFFLNATKFAGVPVSRHWRVPAVPSSGRKRPVGRGTTPVETPPENEEEHSENGSTSNANVRTVSLRSGGTVTLAISVDLFDLSTDDQTFVLGLIKDIRDYADQRSLPPAPSSDHTEAADDGGDEEEGVA